MGYLIEGCILYFQIAAVIYLSLHIYAVAEMRRIRSGKALNRILGLTSMNMFILAILLAVGIVVG